MDPTQGGPQDDVLPFRLQRRETAVRVEPAQPGVPALLDEPDHAGLGRERLSARGLEPNLDRIRQHVEESLMLVTALNPHIGYEKSAEIALKAHREHLSLRDAAIASGHVTAAQFSEWVQPEKMARPNPVA